MHLFKPFGHIGQISEHSALTQKSVQPNNDVVGESAYAAGKHFKSNRRLIVPLPDVAESTVLGIARAIPKMTLNGTSLLKAGFR